MRETNAVHSTQCVEDSVLAEGSLKQDIMYIYAEGIL